MEEEKRDGRSCLKIFRCIGDLPENDGPGPVQDKDSSRRKCKWRFGKRSERRRVLSNNALLTETPPPPPPVTVVREKEEVEEDNSEAPPPPAKISVVKFAEHTCIIPPRPTTDDVCQIEDSIVILIQTSIRRFLAQKEMAKLQSIVKLQAAIRGHLVRRQAIGTLRCVQAIVKLQALVRSRQHRSPAKGGEKDIIISDTKQTIIPSDTKEDIMHSSTEKLLANGFARQLLELLPSGRANVIHISFDPTRSDSAWKWLERWMTVTSSDVSPQKELHLTTTDVQIPPVSVSYHSDEKQEATVCGDDENSAFPVEDQIALNDESDAPSKSPIVEFHDPSRQICVAESEHSRHATERMDESRMDESRMDESRMDELRMDGSRMDGSRMDGSRMDGSRMDGSRMDGSRMDGSRMDESRMDESVEEESDETRRFGVVLRKSFIPAFAAVQSKFDELSAVPKTDMSSSGDNKTPNFADEQPLPQSDVDVFKKLEMNLMAETAASRCGTEISVSSTLDSPDILTEAVVEAEDGDMLFEIGALEASDDHGNADSETTQEQKNEEIDIINSGNHIFATSDHTVPTDEQPKHEQETDQEGNRLPLPSEGLSHMLGTTSQRQACDSNIEKGKKTNARLPAKKPRFQLSGSNSPANQNTEATPENLPKTGKRKNLMGTRKLDDSGDFEPTRISSSSSSNSLPSYMQATESARAKVHANNSPKSASPEVQQHQQQNKESYTTKKRHSLPFIDGKHASSPRMQHQSSKATNAKSPQTPAAGK